MKSPPETVARFLGKKRIAVAGVSRRGDVAANGIYRKLKKSGYEVFPVNPNAELVEGVQCYPDLSAIPGGVDGVVIATHPDVSASVVRQCAGRGVMHVWFHRSIGTGSVSDDALGECRRAGIEPIVGGCPLMFCEPVDVAHRCMRWWLQRTGRVPS
jgi:predicted CoA-binding protein